MNLHGIVSGTIGAVNPFVSVSVRRSAGYTTGPSGSRAPKYTTIPNLPVQVQPLTYKDLQHLDGLNLNGTRRAIYMNGDVFAVIRIQQFGGDLLVFPPGTLIEGDVWLAAVVLEQWPDWCKVAITLQTDRP